MSTEAQKKRTGSFSFRKRWSQIDWRSLASVDVEKIAREMDFHQLQQNITNVTFCNIDTENLHNVDPNFIKLFKLSQLIVEYLLHSQQYLTDRGAELEVKFQETQRELEAMRKQLADKVEELKAVKKENRKRRKAIESYQKMISAGATGLHPCPVCRREFVTEQFLQGHMHRRHPEQVAPPPEKIEFRPDELERKLLEQLMQRLHDSEAHLKEELLKKEALAVEEKNKQFEDWKMEEQKRMKEEMEGFRRHVDVEVELLRKAKDVAEEALERKEAELNALVAKKKLSSLGHLEGAQEMDLRSVHVAEEAKQSVIQLKEQLQMQVNELQLQLKKQEKKWKKKLQDVTSTHQGPLKESLEKIKVLEQSLMDTVQRQSSLDQSKVLTMEVQSLHDRLREQEDQLMNQQQMLEILHERESITPHSSPAQTAVEPLTSVQNISDDMATPELAGSDEVDSQPCDIASQSCDFTPYPNRPQIRCRYNHHPDLLKNLKQESLSILHGALLQRGIPRDVVKLSEAEFECKRDVLHGERQQRVQMHYNFMAQREALVKEVETIAQANCVSQPHKGACVRDLKHKWQVLSASLPVSSKPPKPSKSSGSRLASSAPTSPVPDVLPVSSDKPVLYGGSDGEDGDGDMDKDMDNDCTHTHRVPERVLAEVVVHSNDVQPMARLPALQTSLSVPVQARPLQAPPPQALLSQAPPTKALPTQALPTQAPPTQAPSTQAPSTQAPSTQAPSLRPTLTPVLVASNHASVLLVEDDKDDSPWDSDGEDSIEEIVSGQLATRASSTPIKSQTLGAQVSLAPDPSKRPPGGVQLFPKPIPSKDELEDSLGSDHDQPGPSKNTVMSVEDLSEEPAKPMSRTATSKSALTTVSVEDFDDSDLSDLS